LAEPPVPADLSDALRAPFKAFRAERGGVWREPSVLQPLTLLLDLAGEGLRSRLYVLSAEGGDELALRPDFTIALARAHVAEPRDGGVYLYDGAAFRAPAHGREGGSGEFRQIGVEVFGSTDDPALEDGRIAALAYAASVAGGRSDLSLTFGDIGLFAAFLQAIGTPDQARTRLVRALASGRSVKAEMARLRADAPEGEGRSALTRLLSDLPEAEAAAALEELWRIAGIQPVGGRGAGEIAHRLSERAQSLRTPRLGAAEASLIERYLEISAPPERALDRVQSLAQDAGGGVDTALEAWRRRLDALVAHGAPLSALTLSTAFARAFGYYDGVLFEVRSAALPADAPVAAGGRSDGLLVRLGGTPATSVGCMVRPSRAWAGAPSTESAA
jgi:ATP phosphoribosyltransferase regulatory subunit